MSDYGVKYHHAGTPEPSIDVLPVAEASDVQAHGWGGTGGAFHTPDNIEAAGAEYANLVATTTAAALSKRDADQAVLNK